MTEDARRRLGQTRRLVFQNLCNGVPEAQLMESLQLSQKDVDDARRFVARKITEHRVLRRQPPIACDSITEIRWNRRALLSVLARIGDFDLATDLILKCSVQAMDHPEMLEGMSARVAERGMAEMRA